MNAILISSSVIIISSGIACSDLGNMLNNTSYKYRNNDESSEDNRIFNYKSIEEENKLRIENSRTLRKWKLLAGTGLEYVQFGVDNKAKILIPGAPGTAGTIQDIAFSTQLDLAKYSGFVRAYRNVMGNGTLSFAGRLDGNTYNKHMQNVLNQPTASVSASLPTPVNGLFFNANVGQFTQLPSYTILGYRNAAGALDNQDRVKYIRNRMVAAGLQYNKVKDTRITLEGFYKQYANYPLALNDSIMIVAFAPLVAFLLGLSAITVPWQTLLLSVALYIIVPVIAAQVIRRVTLASGGDAAGPGAQAQPQHRALVHAR